MKNTKRFFTLLFSSLSFILIGQPVSKYQPEQLTPKTLAIIDSTLRVNHNIWGVFKAYGLSGKPAEQYVYWKKKRSSITKKEFFILKNHPSPIIRYYAYEEIIVKDLTDSTFDFIKNHIKDVEILRISSGCIMIQKPIIHYFIESKKLTLKEKEVLQIIVKK